MPSKPFTPGPWTAQPYKNGAKRFRIIQNPYGLLAEVVVGNPANPRVNTEADARLIAAAPALYDALKDLFEQCAMVHKNWGEGSNQREADAAIEQGLAALALVDE